VPDDDIAREAVRRDASHRYHPKNIATLKLRRDDINPNLKGLRGEQAYCEAFGRKVDLSAKPGGDGGRDSDIEIDGKLFIVNCKTAMFPRDLICPVDECKPDTIYVCCHYVPEQDRARMLGWRWGRELMTSWPKTHGFHIVNYWWPARDLRSIDELHRLGKTPRGLMLIEKEERERPPPFHGRCIVCGQPGIYVGWYCEDHRVW
jgi:hypothetical protein